MTGDAVLIGRRIAAIQAETIGEDPGFGALEVLHADRASVEQILTAVRMASLASARLVVVRHVEKLRDDALEALTAALAKAPETSRIVLTAGSLDLRRSAHSRLAKAAALERIEVGGGRDAAAARREILSLIGKLSGERRLGLDRDAAEALVDVLKGDAGRIASELDKLALRFGDEPVGAEEVRDSVAGERPLSAFGLATAVRERKAAMAIAELRRSFAAGQPLEIVLGQIAGEVRALLRARALLDSGLSEDDAKRAFGGGRGYFVVPHARRYRTSELIRALAELGQIDVASKSGVGDAPTRLEAWLVEIGASGSRRPTRNEAMSPRRSRPQSAP